MKIDLKLMFCYACYVGTLSVSCISFAFDPFLFFTDKKISEIAIELTSNCDPSVCHSTDVVQLITHGSSSQYYQILHILNEKGPLCLQFAIEAVRSELNKYDRVPNSCESLIGEDKKNCQNLQIEYAVVNERVLSLVNLMVSKRANLVMPFAQHLLKDEAPSPYVNTSLIDLLQRLEDERSCSQYKIGEEREFIITPFQSKILSYTYYRIRRESEKHYKAFIALEFSLDPFYDGFVPVPIEQVHDHYIGKVRSCMNDINPKLKGPHGEMLEIVIEDARQVNSCRPKRPIQIGSSSGVITAVYYDVHMTCLHTMHEIAHLFGLWDEYIEIYYAPNYNCRVTQENSILSSVSDAKVRWDRVFKHKLDVSLLDPSHFQAILYGNCSLRRNDVKLYRRCSRLSYQTSSHSNACLTEKAYCDRQNILGRDKIAEQQRIVKEIQDLQTELDAINTELINKPDLSRSDPEYLQREFTRSELLYRQGEVQKRIPYLQKRLEYVLSWPDPSTP